MVFGPVFVSGFRLRLDGAGIIAEGFAAPS